MSDPVIDKLTRFTPTDRLDRDEFLFRAGRASAPGRQVWIGLTALLAVAQVTTLAFWFTQSPSVVVNDIPSSADVRDPLRPAPDSYGSLRANWDGDALPTPPGEAVRPESLTLRSVWSDPALK